MRVLHELMENIAKRSVISIDVERIHHHCVHSRFWPLCNPSDQMAIHEIESSDRHHMLLCWLLHYLSI